MLNLNHQVVIKAIKRFASKSPNKTALQGEFLESIDQENCALEEYSQNLSYAALDIAIEQTAKILKHSTAVVLGIAMDNAPSWAIIDLSAMQLNLPVVPLPYFFSAEQVMHAIDDACVNVILSDHPALFEKLLSTNNREILHQTQHLIAGKTITEFTLARQKASVLPENTTKITYTSWTHPHLTPNRPTIHHHLRPVPMTIRCTAKSTHGTTHRCTAKPPPTTPITDCPSSDCTKTKHNDAPYTSSTTSSSTPTSTNMNTSRWHASRPPPSGPSAHTIWNTEQ